MMQTAQIPLLWSELRAIEPRLGQFERVAREATANHWDRYVEWLLTFDTFRRAVESMALQLGVDAEQVEKIILDQPMHRSQSGRTEAKPRDAELGKGVILAMRRAEPLPPTPAHNHEFLTTGS